MLALTFHVGEGRYALDVRRVVEVVPRIALQRVPHSSGSMAGVLDHGGTVVPVIDLGMLLGTQPCASRLSTRIVLVRASATEDGPLLGLIAERVTDLREVPEDSVAPATVESPGARFLGPIVSVDDGLIQFLRIEGIAVAMTGRPDVQAGSIP
jgi:chemotaxis-related protein WspB